MVSYSAIHMIETDRQREPTGGFIRPMLNKETEIEIVAREYTSMFSKPMI